jgi:hypothetical protein
LTGENHPHSLTSWRFKRPTSQSYPHVVACRLGWPRADLPPLCCSVCMWTTYLHPTATSSYLSSRTTLLFKPRAAVHRFLPAIWVHNSVDLSTGYRNGRLPSTPQRAPIYSLIRLRDASKSPD